MRTEWVGAYLDGRSAVRRPAVVRIMRTGLEVAVEDGPRALWPYRELRQTQGAYAGEHVRLERGADPGEALLVADSAFLAAVRQVAPEATGHFHDPARRAWRVGLTVLGALMVVAVTAALYLWGIPAAAGIVAARVPPGWEARLGRAIAEELAPPAARCEEPAGRLVLDRVVEAVTAPLRDSPYAFRVLVVDRGIVNAFALPGGHIVLFRGLLEESARPEVLAGVLAHEIQHVVHRHATRAIFEHASTGLLVAAVTGDVTGALAYGLEAARTLGVLRYSRQHEDEADRKGAELLVRGGLDPRGMIEFFEMLQEKRGESLEVFRYVSTHPSHGERIERLRALVAGAPGPRAPLLSDAEWSVLVRICGPAAAGPEPD